MAAFSSSVSSTVAAMGARLCLRALPPAAPARCEQGQRTRTARRRPPWPMRSLISANADPRAAVGYLRRSLWCRQFVVQTTCGPPRDIAGNRDPWARLREVRGAAVGR
jgi:hypothetical protein